MALSSFYDHRIISRPVRLQWAGWETDTLRLQQAGWSLSAEQDIARATMRLAIRHDRLGMRGLTAISEFAFQGRPPHEPIDSRLQLEHMGRALIIHTHGEFAFREVDATPWLSTEAPKSLDDLAHFGPPLVRTQAVVLPEADVDELLSRILEKQQAAKTEYFRDMVRRDGESVAEHRFHAQIISLPRAA